MIVNKDENTSLVNWPGVISVLAGKMGNTIFIGKLLGAFNILRNFQVPEEGMGFGEMGFGGFLTILGMGEGGQIQAGSTQLKRCRHGGKCI